jgi:glutamate racemase
VIDPAPAVARQVVRLLDSDGSLAKYPRSKAEVFFTSGEAAKFIVLLSRLIGETGEVREVFWENLEIRIR